MKLSFVLLCLSLATLSLASTTSGENCSLSRRTSGKQVGKRDGAPRAAGQSSQVARKKPVQSGKPVLKWRPKKRAGAAKGSKEKSVDVGKDGQIGSTAQDDCSEVALIFPRVIVELIGGYLEGFSVVFTRSWSAADSWSDVAVDSEKHYLITDQDVHASNHGDGEQVSLGFQGLSDYKNFHSSHDGRSVFFTCNSKTSSKTTARWLVQGTSTDGLQSVTFEGDEASFVGSSSMLSANGRALLTTVYNSTYIGDASVYQIKEHGKAVLASKKGDFDGRACAASGNGNFILVECEEKLEIHNVGGDGCHLVLEINYAGVTNLGPYALSSDGSKTAFIVDECKLYVMDGNKEKGTISIDKLTAINVPTLFLKDRLIYDAKDRLYALISGSLSLVDPSERKLVSLEEAQVPQGYEIWSSAISPNVDYIVILFRSNDENEKGEHQYQLVIKRKEDTQDALMRLCGYKS